MTKTAGGLGLQGVQQIPLDGVSMVYTWNNATAKDEFGGGDAGAGEKWKSLTLLWVSLAFFFAKIESQKIIST